MFKRITLKISERYVAAVASWGVISASDRNLRRPSLAT